MNANTLNLLQQFRDLEWFTSVGLKDLRDVVFISSWQDALKNCETLEWENTAIEAANQLSGQIVSVSMERFRLWNLIVRDAKTITVPLVKQKISNVILNNKGLSKRFEGCVQWDILHAVMESEYSDLVAPSFYANLSQCYLRGHFPCGWDGQYPDGKLMVF